MRVADKKPEQPARVICECTLGHPPTVNTYWRVNFQTKRVHISRTGRQYRDDATWQLLGSTQIRNFAEPVRLEMWWTPMDKRKRDADNVIKVTMDCFGHGSIIQCDSQIHELHLVRCPPKKPGAIHVRLVAL